MIYTLFGGRETRSRVYDIYESLISSLDDSYRLSVKAFWEKQIRSTVPKVSDPALISELNKKGFLLTNLQCNDNEIQLLLGADVAGILFLDKSVQLDSGLFLLQTRLGYILTGKQEAANSCQKNWDTVLNVISLCVKEINDIWSLKSIGILDPVQILNKNNEYFKVMEEFKNSMKILPNGRYEVYLPFKSDIIEFS